MRFNSVEGQWKRAALATAILAAGATAGCGGGGGDGPGNNSGNGGSVQLGEANLATPEAAQAQAATFVTFVSNIESLEALEPANVPKAKATSNCEGGGTEEDSTHEGVNVGSPFTDKAMLVQRTTFAACKYTEQSSYGEGNSTSFALTLNGPAESGSVDDNGHVSYAKLGTSETNPFQMLYVLDHESTHEGTTSRAKTTLDFGLFFRDDARETNSSFDEKLVMNLTGKYASSGTANGHLFSSEGRFTSYLGKTGAPFTVAETNEGLSISGEYGFGLDPVPQGLDCASAKVSVETTTPLADSTTMNGGSPFEAGVIKLTSGATSATVQFNNDGTVTVTPQGGSPSTVNYQELAQKAAPCAGLVFAGVAFASGQFGN